MNEIIGAWNARPQARISGNGWRGRITHVKTVECKIMLATGDHLWFSYGELNADSEMTFEK